MPVRRLKEHFVHGAEAEKIRQKLRYLCRCVPLAETNVNPIELAPRETGKTYLYRNISYYAHVLSGGKGRELTRMVYGDRERNSDLGY